MADHRHHPFPAVKADVPEDSAAVEITGAIAEDNSLKFVTEAEITGTPDISSFGTTFIPLQLFDDENGNLNADLSADGAHVLGKYYADWSDWILQKLQQQDVK